MLICRTDQICRLNRYSFIQNLNLEMQRFALMGAAGFVAERHMKAIKDTGHELVAAMDTTDSVGIIDRYFPEAAFFVEYERLDRYIAKLLQKGEGIDYLSICTPNHLHDAHIRFGLRNDAHVICEKPLVLNPWNAVALAELEQKYQHRVNCILQLRLHEQAIALKKRVSAQAVGEVQDVELTYITARGLWYYASWKGDEAKSGGIATNIGVHFFDLLLWLYGDVIENEVHVYTHDRAAGVLRLEHAHVRWFLSINEETLPDDVKENKQRVYRQLRLGDQVFDFSQGFDDLHTRSYQQILGGDGYGISDALPAIELVHQIRHAELSPLTDQCHPLVHLPLTMHPFKRR